MSDWEVALERQIATWAFMRSEKGERFMAAYLADVQSKYPEEWRAALDLREKATAILWAGEPIYVSREMCRLVAEAVKTFEPEPLSEEDLFLPGGFAYLAEPFWLTDVHHKRMSHRAVAWHTGVDEQNQAVGVQVVTFSGVEDEDDYFLDLDEGAKQRHRAYFGRALAMGHATPIRFGREPANLNLPVLSDTAKDLDLDQVKQSSIDFHRYLQVLWRLMGQRIAVGMRVRAPRAWRKHVEREGFRDHYVTVVTLRRPKGQPSEERHHVDWAQRWIVSGHWRWQPYGDGTHRQIWISPYVKGPDSKPLVLRGARVFRWAR